MEKRPENYQVGRTDDNFSPNSYGSNGGGRKTAVAVLSVVAAILAVILAVIVIRNSKLISELNGEKADLTEQIKTLQEDFAALSSDYDSINSQLDSSRAEIDILVQKIQKTDATNRAKIRQYQKELGTLRAIMKNYVHQIDSLNTLNHKLTAAAANARKEAAEAKKQNAELKKTVDDLSGKVETGSIINGRGIKAVAYNRNGKVVDRANAAADLLVSVTLTENRLAPTGPLRVYIAVTDPNNNLLVNSESISCHSSSGAVPTSASRVVDYQGAEVDMGIYLKGISKYVKGIYNVKVMTERSVLGETQFMLR